MGPEGLTDELESLEAAPWLATANAIPPAGLPELPDSLNSKVLEMVALHAVDGLDTRQSSQRLTVTTIPTAEVTYAVDRKDEVRKDVWIVSIYGLDHRVKGHIPDGLVLVDWLAVQSLVTSVLVNVWAFAHFALDGGRFIALTALACGHAVVATSLCAFGKWRDRRRVIEQIKGNHYGGAGFAISLSVIAWAVHVAAVAGFDDEHGRMVLAYFSGEAGDRAARTSALSGVVPAQAPLPVKVRFVEPVSVVLRAQPSARAPALRTLPIATRCEVANEANPEWTAVRCAGADGWVKRELLVDVEPTVEGLRSMATTASTTKAALAWAMKVVALKPEDPMALSDFRARYALAVHQNLVELRAQVNRRPEPAPLVVPCDSGELKQRCIAAALASSSKGATWTRVGLVGGDFVAVAGQGDRLSEFAGHYTWTSEEVGVTVEQTSRYRAEYAARALRSDDAVSDFEPFQPRPPTGDGGMVPAQPQSVVRPTPLAGLDCSGSSSLDGPRLSGAELVICGDPDLQQLDAAIARHYNASLIRATQPMALAQAEAYAAWIRERDLCFSRDDVKACLRGQLQERERSLAGAATPQDPAALLREAELRMREKPGEAQALLKQCIDQRETFAECHRQLGALYERFGEPKLSLTHYRRFLELEPNSGWAEQVNKSIARLSTP